jgi:hypothetical protein
MIGVRSLLAHAQVSIAQGSTQAGIEWHATNGIWIFDTHNRLWLNAWPDTQLSSPECVRTFQQQVAHAPCHAEQQAGPAACPR